MMVLRRNTLLWVILRDLYFPLDTSLLRRMLHRYITRCISSN